MYTCVCVVLIVSFRCFVDGINHQEKGSATGCTYQHLEAELDIFKEEIKHLKAHSFGVERNQRLLVGNVATPIAFYAHLSSSISESNHTIVYDNVVTNVGNGYNKFSGTFQAPVSGIYHFTVTVMSKNDVEAHVQILRNGVTVGWSYASTEGYESGSTSIILELKANDSIWVKEVNQSTRYLSGLYNNFSGFLVYQR